MVYCKLLSKGEKYISYSIGALYDDLTGEIRIDTDGAGYEIIKQPKNEDVHSLFISKMLIKYQPLFSRGEAPEKMSYEI